MKSIRFKDISFSYGDKIVFKNFNIDFNKGLNFIIGNNGSGKTTLFNIAKHKLPFMGNIFIDNIELNKNDILCLDLDYINSLNGTVKDLIDDSLISYLNLNDYLDCDIATLSLSLKIKVAFTILFSSNHNIYFIDDMLAWLNKIDREKVLKKLKTLSKNKIILIITNNLEDTLFSSRIVLLDEGNIVIDDSLENFYNNEKILNSYGFQLPFIVDLSLNLKLYNTVDKIYFNQRKLVDELWK